MTSRSIDSRMVKRVLVGSVLLLFVFLAVDRFLPSSGAKKFAYDKKGRLISRTTLNGRMVKYAYDKAGLLTNVSYHQLGAITKLAYPGGDSVKYEYDLAGNRVAMNDGRGKTRYDYDDSTRLSLLTTFDGKKISYEYDPWNQVRRIVLPDGSRIDYQYDLAGNIIGVNDGQQAGLHYEYHPDTNQVYRRLPNGILTVYEYSPLGELNSIRHLQADGTPICSYRYTHDSEGRINQIEEATSQGVVTTSSEYDLAGRVSKVSQSDGSTVTYEYDLMGNRTAQTDTNDTIRYEYDARGRLAKAGEETFTYDAAGNAVSRKSKAESVAYKYDDENRLLEVHSSRSTIRYAYDGEGNRVRREVNGRVTNYLNELVMGMPQVIGEYDKDGKISRHLLGQTRVGKRNANGETLYFLEDHLGSTRCVVDASGKVVTRYSYSAFGAPKVTEGTSDTDSLYTGEFWDPDAHLLYLRSRYYDPELGRFLSPDPLPGSPMVPESFNQYVYVNDDPINRVDPSGLRDMESPSDFSARPWPLLLQMPPHPPQPPPLRLPSPRTSSSPPSPLQPFQGRHFDYIVAYSGGVALVPYLHEFGITSKHPVINLGGAAYAGSVNIRAAWDPVPLLISALGLGQSGATYRVATSSALNRHDLTTSYLPAFDPIPADKSLLFIAGIRTNEKQSDSLVRDLIGKNLFPRDTSVVVPYGHGTVQDLWDAYTTFRRGDPDRGRTGLFDFFQSRDLEDDQRKYYSPFPPGGGGGSAPSVGGVYLDQAAKVIGELGAITGAVYDPTKGQMILIGDKNTALPAMKPEYLGAAIRAVYSESQHEPGMTIDPNPQNPHAPLMNVIFFGNTGNTRLGWVMFEADRVMKGYSVGNDNITKSRVQSAIPGYQSVAAMILRNGDSNSGLWSRFWLVPEPVTGKVSEDGRTIIFDPIRMRVRTETMRWDGGKLVSAGGIKDSEAEAFAEHFTRQYEDFARESPIYAELKQVTQAVALAKWMKQQNIPVDWNFVRLYAGSYSTPDTTPAAYSELTERVSDGMRTGIRNVNTFGGVDMSLQLQVQKTAEAEKFHNEIIKESSTAQKQGQLSFSFKSSNRELKGIALPGNQEREISTYSLTESEAGRCLDVSAEVAQLPGLARYYNSSHNEPTELGFSWSQLLPRLEFESVSQDGRTPYLSVAGDHSTNVMVRRFFLHNQFGLGSERFVDHFVDQDIKRIGFAPEKSRTIYRGLYPEKDGTYRLIFNSRQEAIFDAKGNLRAILKPDSKALYDYDQDSHLISIRLSHDNKEEQLHFEFDVKGRLVSSSAADGARAKYDYDEAGNLGSVNCGGRTSIYRYNERRLLVQVSIDGELVVENSYDEMGRLLKQKDLSGNQLELKTDTTADGKLVTVKDGLNSLKRYYDSQQKLVRVENSDGTTSKYSYDDAGQLARIEESLPTGGKATMEVSPDHKTVTIQDPRGVRAEYRFNDHNQLAETAVNNRRAAVYRYDDRDRLSAVSYENGGSETLSYDGEGRVLEYRREDSGNGGRATEVVSFSYNQQGEMTGIGNSAMGQVLVAKEPGVVTVTRGNAVLRYQYDGDRLAKVEGPAGAAVTYTYQPDGRLRGLELSRGGLTRRLEFTDNSVLARNSSGGDTRYLYAPTGLLSSVQNSYGGQTLYSYDDKNRLQRIELPNGRCLEYLYDPATGWLREERATVCGK